MKVEEIARARRFTADPAACRALRIAAGVSQSELAASLGVSVAAVSRWEAGQRRPRSELAIRWATTLRELSR
jgi:transcriptional regulator with XRE-family HTH domain